MSGHHPALEIETRHANGRRARKQLAREQVARWLSRLRGKRVAVVGDVMLDEFLWGDATRISPEAPVPVVLLERRTWSLGGAGNVAANVTALGGEAVLFGSVGEDRPGERIAQLLQENGIGIGELLPVRGRPTTVKHRVFARNKHLLRFDSEETSPLAESSIRELLRAVEHGGPFDAIIVSDYAKGCVTPALVRGLSRICAQQKLPWCADPKDTDIRYRAATVLKPNLHELEAMTGVRQRGENDLRRAAVRALRIHRCDHLLVTRGRDGMALFAAAGQVTLVQGAHLQVSDVTGAGDTVHAALGLGLAAGLDAVASMVLANLAGGYVVSLPGTAVARPADILASLQ